MKNKIKATWIAILYAAALLFCVFKMFYYAAEIEGFPDEICHIGYIIHLEETKEIIPDFDNMPLYAEVSSENKITEYAVSEGTHNYLGHPPLYYHIMRLSRAVKNDNGRIIVNVGRLRHFNIFIVSVMMGILMYAGYVRISKKTDRVFPHVVFTAAAISVPMFTYVGAGVSNDNLAFAGIVLFLIGVLRYFEENDSMLTYALVGLGFLTASLSKVTLGEILGVSLLVILFMDAYNKKSFKLILNKRFACSLIFYAIPLMYLIILRMKFGTFQPTLKSIDFAYYQSTSFYVPIGNRSIIPFLDYIEYYWKNFINTWTILYGHVVWVEKEDLSLPSLVYIFEIIVFAAYCIWSVYNKKKYTPAFLGIFAGVIVTAISQYINGYHSFIEYGYMGGYQARYYLAVIPFFALGNGLMFAQINEGLKKAASWKRMLLFMFEAVYVYLLIYGDFIYFLLNCNLRNL